MDNIFEQIDEQIEQDRVHKFWQENWQRIVAGFMLFFLGLFAYVGWRDYRRGQDLAASDLFMAARVGFDGENSLAGQAGLKPLLESHPKQGYGLLARLLSARALAEEGDADGAVSQLESLAESAGSSSLRGLALLNAAYLTVGDAQRAGAFLSRIGPKSPYRAHALELEGLLAAKAGDDKTAVDRYRSALVLGAEGSLRQRLDQRLERLGGTEKK